MALAQSRITPRRVGFTLAMALAALLALSLGTRAGVQAQADHNSHGDADIGFTDGWFDGRTVLFHYNKPFFCVEPPSSGAATGCEVGAEPETFPRPGNIPTLYVMTPLGFTPDQATLQCPVVGFCINHPGTIDVSRIFGAGTESIPLPAHSHIVEVRQAGWWELEVIGVFDEAIWDEIVAAKSLERVRELQAAFPEGITGDIPTNAFLFFSVQG